MTTPGTQEVIQVPSDILLNLDDVVSEDQYVQFKGAKHLIQAPSVEAYLVLLLAKRKFLRENGGVEDEYIQAQQAISLITSCIPTIPGDEVKKMSLQKLQKLTVVIEAATGNNDEVVEEAKDTKGE